MQIGDPRAQQMQRQIRFGQAQPKKPQAAPSVTATANLTAEFTLKSKPGEDLILEFQSIRQQIKEANLNASKPSAEQQEEAEEQQAMAAQMMAQGEGQMPGEPSFTFVAKVPDADRDKVIADAFSKAKVDAEPSPKPATSSSAPSSSSTATAGPDFSQHHNYDPYGYRQAMVTT